MPFTTGTAWTASELLSAMNTFMTANGWTKVRGETDMNVASPKAARYWRTLSWRSTFMGLQQWNLRTAIGGANVTTDASKLSINRLESGTLAGLLTGAGGNVRTNSNPGAWIITYDFGSPTVVREVYLRGDTSVGNYALDNLMLQWSNDGKTWTTLQLFDGITGWVNSGYKTFTVADGTVYNQHLGAALPRRSGSKEDGLLASNYSTNGYRDFSDDIWIWQGPGYDADRRVYIHARGHSNSLANTCSIEWIYSTSINTNAQNFFDHPGAPTTSVFHLFANATVNYWFYVNSHRVILITQSNVSDYTSSYAGFLSAFAQPDYYQFPLCVSATSGSRDLVSASSNALSSMADPGQNAMIVKLPDSSNRMFRNRTSQYGEGNHAQGADSNGVVWPYHFGRLSQTSDWPTSRGGGTFYNTVPYSHLFDKLIPTVQNELPMFPCIATDKVMGSLGAMTGVLAVPGGGLLAPGQLIAIGSSNYRVFPNRSRRQASEWFVVKEE